MFVAGCFCDRAKTLEKVVSLKSLLNLRAKSDAMLGIFRPKNVSA